MTSAICPICKQQFQVPTRLFYDLKFNPQVGLYDAPSDRALYYHKVDGRYCGSNGVKKQ